MRFGNMAPMPTVSKNILYINIGAFVLTYIFASRGIDLIEILGLHYFNSPYFKPVQIFTYQFLHGGLMHILLNMYGLYIFGSQLERVWGEKKFLFFYLFCVAGSAIFIFAIDAFNVYKITGFINPLGKIEEIPRSVIEIYSKVTIGASGAIMGLLAAFATLFPNTEMMIIPFPVPIKTKYLAIGYGVIEVYLGIANRSNDNIAHFAHVGGLLFGFFLVLYWNKTNRKTFY
jgi:membrane associated rhomboid family serine protease